MSITAYKDKLLQLKEFIDTTEIIIFADFKVKTIDGHSRIVDVGMTSTNNDFISRYIKTPTLKSSPLEEGSSQTPISLPELLLEIKERYDFKKVPIFYYSPNLHVETLIESCFLSESPELQFNDIKFINLCLDLNPAKSISLYVPDMFTWFDSIDLYQQIDKENLYSEDVLSRAFPKSVILRSLTLKLISLPEEELIVFYNHFKLEIKERHMSFISDIYK